MADRDNKGRFQKGHRQSGPGRPARATEQALVDAVASAIGAEEVRAAISVIMSGIGRNDQRAASALIRLALGEHDLLSLLEREKGRESAEAAAIDDRALVRAVLGDAKLRKLLFEELKKEEVSNEAA